MIPLSDHITGQRERSETRLGRLFHLSLSPGRPLLAPKELAVRYPLRRIGPDYTIPYFSFDGISDVNGTCLVSALRKPANCLY